MDNPLDQTSLATISLLESRLLRIEHVLYGPTASHPPVQQIPAIERLRSLERRFLTMVSHVRVYGELLKIYKSNQDLFHAPDSSQAPSQLSTETIQSIVLASASSFPSTLSSLTAVQDSPIPDPAESAALISLTDKMKAIEATQMAQSAKISELRRRSETVIRIWYETGILSNSQSLADIETRVEKVERQIRRREHAIEEERQI